MDHAEAGGDVEVDLANQQIRSLGADGSDSAPVSAAVCAWCV